MTMPKRLRFRPGPGPCSPASAHAQLYFGAKAALVDYDLPDSDPGVSGVFVLGSPFWRNRDLQLALEGELTLPVVDSEVGGNDAGFESLGVFGALRTRGPVHFIGRVGLVQGEIGTRDELAAAFGFGIGLRSGGYRWRFEYTAYTVEDVDVDVLSVGLQF
ncbi:MAG: hypothetical protein KatS3mg121_1529 [Gammaproteobacteria bacterium]|nr:MAG: hypothetical protein KatS3mg121_1529 [Gammaproteobacteria bacterium]